MAETEQSALLDDVNSNSQQGSAEQQKHEKVTIAFLRSPTGLSPFIMVSHLNLALDHSSSETIVTILGFLCLLE